MIQPIQTTRPVGPARETVTLTYERVPLQEDITGLIGDLQDASDPREVRLYGELVQERFQEFKDRRGCGHSNSEWACEAGAGRIEFHLGSPAEALEHDRRSLKRARTRWERGQSLDNISVSLRALGQPADAIPAAMAAIQMDPRNECFWADLTLALFQDGATDAADSILVQVPKLVDLQSPHCGWRAAWLGSEEFRDVELFLESARAIRRAILTGKSSNAGS